MTVHVYPERDTVEHLTDGRDCPCNPKTEPVVTETGIGWLIKHRKVAA